MSSRNSTLIGNPRVKKLLILPVLFFSVFGYSQDYYRDSSESPKPEFPVSFYGFSIGSGINSPVGMIGIDAEVNVGKAVSFLVGVGIGSWGYKSTFGLRCYISQSQKWGLNVGYSRSTGIDSVALELDPMYIASGNQNENVSFKLKQAGTLNFTMSNHNAFGAKRRVRFILEFGYSMALEAERYSILSNHTLTQQGKTFMRIMQPSGPVVAMRLNFGASKPFPIPVKKASY